MPLTNQTAGTARCAVPARVIAVLFVAPRAVPATANSSIIPPSFVKSIIPPGKWKTIL